MNGSVRREKLMELLQASREPISGSALAKTLQVSRQVIVQDMALLRARTDVEIISTYQGYVLRPKDEPCSRVFKVRHSADRTEEELLTVVDLGGHVEDVFVYHSVYGVVRGQLGIRSRRDVSRFMERLRESCSAPLMGITDDYHYHTVTAPDGETLDHIRERLQELELLAPLRDHEPAELGKTETRQPV